MIGRNCFLEGSRYFLSKEITLVFFIKKSLILYSDVNVDKNAAPKANLTTRFQNLEIYFMNYFLTIVLSYSKITQLVAGF
ncbi:hypothetical protein ACE193_14990 [Bernardetia sp. OM2101]|uniref:hypothetical protein n=1 Tax=Bernardetia sp. OM2101 TaxID=3344876 RepID=UPI0035D0D49F